MKKIVLIALTLSLAGCYANWPELDKAAKNIECDMDQVALGKIAKRFKAESNFDEISNSYSMVKFDDAIVVSFNHKSKITTIAKTKSDISLGGLMRRQGDVMVVKRCVKQ
ncbi:hypothetical protein ACMAZF_09680 [Psychrobium sp. nBUS_13]|uniref:hypothetical protein n=1 Tax=Psychrobium sp. nBUS_13 TaxID=3395319 RepID=UPI003EBE400C